MLLYRLKDILKYVRIAFFISLFAIVAWVAILIALKFIFPVNPHLATKVMLALFMVCCSMLALLVGLRLAANIIENCSTSQRETEFDTRWLRDYCYKQILDTDSDEIKGQKEEYNKIVKSMRMIYDSKKDTMTFYVKIANLQQKKIFDEDKKDIIDSIKEEYPSFQFDEYANNKMIGYSKY